MQCGLVIKNIEEYLKGYKGYKVYIVRIQGNVVLAVV